MVKSSNKPSYKTSAQGEARIEIEPKTIETIERMVGGINLKPPCHRGSYVDHNVSVKPRFIKKGRSRRRTSRRHKSRDTIADLRQSVRTSDNVFRQHMGLSFKPKALKDLEDTMTSVSGKIDTLDVESINLMVTKLTNVFSKFDDSVDISQISDVVHKVEDACDTASIALEDNIPKISSLLDTFTSFSDTISQFKKMVKELEPIVLVSMLSSLMLWYAKSEDKRVLGILILLCFIVLLRSSSSVRSFVFDFILDIKDFVLYTFDIVKDEFFRPHMCMSSITNSVCAFIFGLFGWQGITSSKFGVGNVQKFFMTYDKQVNNARSSMIMFIKMLEDIANFMSSTLGSDRIFNFVETQVEGLDMWTNDVKKQVRLVEKQEFVFEEGNYELILELEERGTKILKSIPSTPDMQVTYNLAYMTLRELSKIRDHFTKSSFVSDGIRQEPVGILFRGAPGGGKSQLIQEVHAAICARTLPESMLVKLRARAETFMFNRCSENEYWEGFDSFKWVTVVDDLGQIRDTATTTCSSWMEIIRMINQFPYPLHMATLERKSNTLFHSKFVIATTNDMHFNNVESINHIDAVKRRFPFTVDVSIKPEYTKEQVVDGKTISLVDPAKLPVVDGLTQFDHSVNNFVVQTSNGVKTTVDFNEMIDMFVSAFEDRKNWLTSKRGVISSVVDEQIARRKFKPQGFFSWFTSGRHDGKSEQEILMDNPYIEDEDEYFDASDPLQDLLYLFDVDRASEDSYIDSIMSQLPGVPGSRWHSWRWNKIRAKAYGLSHIFGIMYHEIFTNESVCESLDFAAKHLNEYLHPDYLCQLDDDSVIYYALSLVNFEPHILRQTNLFKGYMDDIIDPKITKFIRSNVLDISSVAIDTLHQEAISSWNSIKERAINPALNKLYRWIRKCRNFMKQHGYVVWLNLITMIMQVFVFVILPLLISLLVNLFMSGKKRKKKNAARVQGQFGKQAGVIEPKELQSFDKNSDDVIAKILSRNTYEFCTGPNEDELVRSGFATFVRGNVAIIPFHFAAELFLEVEHDKSKADCIVCLRKTTDKDGKPVNFYFKISEFLKGVIYLDESEDQDFCAFVAPRSVVHPHCDIVKFFCKESLYNKVSNYRFRLVYPYRGKRVETFGTAKPITYPVQISSDHGDRQLLKGFRYEAPTSVGDCGALFCLMTKNSNLGTVFGIHVAGMESMGIGLASCISREKVEALLSAAHIDDKILVDLDPEVPFGPEVTQDGFVAQMNMQSFPSHFTPVGISSIPTMTGGKSKLRRSRLFEAWGPSLKRPARLNDFVDQEGQIIQPYIESIRNYGNNMRYISSAEAEMCCESYFEMIRSKSTYITDKRVLTFNEAVAGLDTEPEFGSINRKTSLGFPYSVSPLFKGPGKTSVFGDKEVFNLDNQRCEVLRGRVDHIITCARNGHRLLHCYTDFNKDELRSIAKSKAGKSRLVSGGPTDLLICFLMYYGDFVLWFKKNRLKNGSAVGINPYSEEWNDLALRLIEKGGNCPSYGSGDMHHFDGDEVPPILWSICNSINKWYDDGEDNARIRRILFLEIVNSRHIRGIIIYEWFSGMPSGNALTTIVNTIYVQISMRLAWGVDFGFTSRSLEEFNKNVYLISFGDDGAFAVSPKYRDKYTESTVACNLVRYGLDYTSETKDGVHCELRYLDEITFLKRYFRFDADSRLYIAPLDMATILESPYWWQQDSLNEVELVKQRVQNSVEELSLHGPVTFKYHAEKMIGALLEFYNERLDRTSYLTCRNFLLSRGSAWARDF